MSGNTIPPAAWEHYRRLVRRAVAGAVAVVAAPVALAAVAAAFGPSLVSSWLRWAAAPVAGAAGALLIRYVIKEAIQVVFTSGRAYRERGNG